MRLDHNPLLLLALSVSLFTLSACDKKEADKPTAGQIAAKVNSGEISIHQLNFLLARSGANAKSPEAGAKLRRDVLDKLIEQELAIEQAVDKKLDRSPDVLMAIEAARRDILARAYMDQIAKSLAKPTAEETKKYYSEHPQLFSERRIYNIQEIAMPASPGVSASLREMLDTGKSLEDIINWLKSKEIKFAGGSATRAAEQIPLELLPRLHTLKVGQSMIIENPQTVTLMRLAAAQSVPFSEEAALPRIEQFLGNQRTSEAVMKEIKQLKEKAKITYMGEFASTAATPAATPAATDTTTTANPSDSGTQPAPDSAIEKGIAGLK